MSELHDGLSTLKPQEGSLLCFLGDLLYSSGLSLNATAERSGKARTTLIRWRDNTAKEFEFETLARLCALFVYPRTSGTSPEHIPLSLLLEYQPKTDQEKSRTIPVVQALLVLPKDTGRHQIICTLQSRLEEDGISYQELARQLSETTKMQAETLSEIARNRTSAISRHTLTLLCQRYGSIERLFVFDPRARV